MPGDERADQGGVGANPEQTPGKGRWLFPREGDPPMPWLWLGTWSLGGEGFGPSDARISRQVLDRALDAGIRHIDTAGFYARGKSEALVAGAVRGRRAEVFISTKGGLTWEGNGVRHRGRPDDLRRELAESLERLGTGYVDLFQLHWPDPEVPLDESLDALRGLRAEGLIRHWGAGNLDADQVVRFVRPGSRMPHQVHFNPLHRPVEVLAAGRHGDRCIHCAVSPLEQGLLGSGNSARGLEALGKKDVRRRNPLFHSAEAAAWLAEYRRLLDGCPLPGVSLVLLWILARDDVDAVIPGPRTPGQLDEVLAHREWMQRMDLPAPEGKRARFWGGRIREMAGTALASHLGRGLRSVLSP